MPGEPRLANKTAVITGGSTGIGLATAKLFLREGARVLITGLDEGRLAAALQELGAGALAVRADVRRREDLERLAERVSESFGSLDVLFANAGVSALAPLEHVTEAQFDELFGTNVKGLFFTVQTLVGRMKAGASILLNASTLVTQGVPSTSVYIATKAAVRSLTRSLAAELGPRGIRVNALSPGLVPTALQGKWGLPPEVLSGFDGAVLARTALGRMGEVEDIARAALFLASDDSSFMTAADVVVDGGYRDI